jgi:hypothetical protein
MGALSSSRIRARHFLGPLVPGATIDIRNDITRYEQTVTTDAAGSFRFTNVPFNPYVLTTTLSGFRTVTQNVTVRSTVPQEIKITLTVGGVAESVTVSASIIENVPTAHSDVDTVTLATLPSTMAGSGLSEAITMLTPGVVNDSNAFFHPLGDHAETSFQIDGQPINDQISKVFSTPNNGATRIRMPAPGTADDDTNPPRIAPRHLFDVVVGTDVTLAGSRRLSFQFTVVNLTNREALYNFLSTFGGTHFVQPRTYQAKLGFVF